MDPAREGWWGRLQCAGAKDTLVMVLIVPICIIWASGIYFLPAEDDHLVHVVCSRTKITSPCCKKNADTRVTHITLLSVDRRTEQFIIWSAETVPKYVRLHIASSWTSLLIHRWLAGSDSVCKWFETRYSTVNIHCSVLNDNFCQTLASTSYYSESN